MGNIAALAEWGDVHGARCWGVRVRTQLARLVLETIAAVVLARR
jgi:hypothetical protein